MRGLCSGACQRGRRRGLAVGSRACIERGLGASDPSLTRELPLLARRSTRSAPRRLRNWSENQTTISTTG